MILNLFRLALPFLTRYRWYLAAFALLSSSATAAYFTAQYKDGQQALREQRQQEYYIKELEKQHAQHVAEIEAVNKKAIEAQTELSRLNTDLEKKYRDATKQASNNAARLERAISDGLRLRDKWKAAEAARTAESNKAKGGATSTPNSSNGSPATDWAFSETATRRLFKLADEADQQLERLRISNEYALKLHAICQKLQNE
mgnify:FL=1|jgi:hypothetical protein|nr:MAG TPA: hypothetical protein [Caudoviricetes sp.]